MCVCVWGGGEGGGRVLFAFSPCGVKCVSGLFSLLWAASFSLGKHKLASIRIVSFSFRGLQLNLFILSLSFDEAVLASPQISGCSLIEVGSVNVDNHNFVLQCHTNLGIYR